MGLDLSSKYIHLLLWQHMTGIANVMKMSSAPPCDCDMGVLMHAVHSVFRVYIEGLGFIFYTLHRPCHSG